MVTSFGDELYTYGENLPRFPALFITGILDLIPFVSNIWRQVIPFELAISPHGPLSHTINSPQFPTLHPLPSVWSLSQIQQFLITPSTVLGDLTTPEAFTTVVILVIILNYLKTQILLPYFSRIGLHLATKTHGVEWCRLNHDRIDKFGEYCFRFVYHSSVSIFGLYYFADKAWWDSNHGGTVNLWLDHPHQPIDPGMTWYYIIQAAYSIEVLVHMMHFSVSIAFRPWPQLGWKDTARGDFLEMTIHHVATIGLIILSSSFRFSRIGSMIFLVHDISDVPVDMSKLANFLKWKVMTVLCFVTMIIVWLITRLGIFPFIIYRSVLYESQILMTQHMTPEFYFAYRPPFIILIGVLIMLHLVWFGIIMKIGWVLVTKGQTHDLTEHKSGEVVKGVDNEEKKVMGSSNGKKNK